MNNQIRDEIKNFHSNELINLSFDISNEWRKSKINNIDEILIEYNKYVKKISIINLKIINVKDNFLLSKF